MHSVEFGLFLVLCLSVTASSTPASTVKREADYTLDDSFWKEEDSPVGEVERLLKEYRQNQELVKNIGAHYYQIIYPVQLRHHEKMGISTREIGTKYPQRGYSDGTGTNYQSSSRSRSRTGKHFHRTSLLIKAFNHKFRLDLELNTQLLAPNMVQKHHLHNGAEQLAAQEIEHCYYHGTVKDYPGAAAAFHTCNGVSGVIHLGNETFVIHPFYGGDLSKHPHVIFEARAKQSKGCANSGNLDWRKSIRRSKQAAGLKEDPEPVGRYRRSGGDVPLEKRFNLFRTDARKSNSSAPSENSKSKESVINNSKIDDNRRFKKFVLNSVFHEGIRFKRDVREATKFVETAIVLDKAMFDKRNGSTRTEVIHDAIQVANIADLYFRTLNTRVSIVYIETWQSSNKVVIDKNQDISRALLNFNDYTSRKMFKIDKDTSQLLTGEPFAGGEAGMAVPEAVCTTKSVGISVDVNAYEPHLVAATMAHMIGHNIGMGHDDGREGCYCRDWHGCLMAQAIVGLDNVQPYSFSECSRMDYIDALRIGHGICLLNKPNEFDSHRSCGNGIVEEGEMCDCGTIEECHENDPCCDPITCKLTSESECASGPCCENCRLRSRGVTCRAAANECDLPEHCNGESGVCPMDLYKKNGSPCSQDTGYCFNGVCPTLNLQCEAIWGYGGIAADKQCFEQFNSKGSLNGHCGVDENGQYIKCEPENARCGSLQCQLGNRQPVVDGVDQLFSRTIISIKGVEYECKSISGKAQGSKDIRGGGLVKDGTPCGDHLICVNQTCTSLYLHLDPVKCPSNSNNQECSGHGVCSNINHCYCEPGWTGPDCSIETEIIEPPTEAPSSTGKVPTSKEDLKAMLESQMQKKVTPYGGNNNNLSTLAMVFILVGVVKGVFICFTLMAVCYRGQAREFIVTNGVLLSCCVFSLTLVVVSVQFCFARRNGELICEWAEGLDERAVTAPAWECPEETETVVPSRPPSRLSSSDSIEHKRQDYHSTNTGFLVGMLMSVVGGVFILFALMALCYSWRDGDCGAADPPTAAARKTTMPKYEAPYEKKPVVKKTSTASGTEETSVDSGNKIITFGSMPSYSRGDSHRVIFRPDNQTHRGTSTRFSEHKNQQIKRGTVASTSEDDPGVSGEEEAVAFIDIPPSNLSKLPEKGILKKPYGTMTEMKEKWSEDSQSDNQETLSQSDHVGEVAGATMSEVERALKNLNGYHEDILEALRTAASHSTHRGPPGGLGMHTPSGSSSLLSDEIMRKSLMDRRCSRGGSQEKICDHVQTHTVLVDAHRRDEEEEEELPPSCGPIRIRNLEDLVRQLEHHSGRHMSPSGSEDIRMSETEADRHYRLEATDPQAARPRPRPEDDPRFVYGRYRHPTATGRPHTSPHTHQHGHGYLPEEDGIYESADRERVVDCGETPDSESDEFIQAQPVLVRSASEEIVPGVSGMGGTASVSVHRSRPRETPTQNTPTGTATTQREYYPSPLSGSDSEDSPNDAPSTAPEYKH